MFQTNQTD